MKAVFKLNPGLQREWRAAMHGLAKVAGKEDPEGLQKLVKQSAIRFVKNVASVTPPSQGEADQESKVRGEQAILTDLLKIAIAVTPAAKVSKKHAAEVFADASELLAVHERARSGAAGRVNPRNRKEKLLVKQNVFQSVLKKLQAKVGFLAAALNAAANRLGFSLPAWIKRHGSAFGSIEVAATDSSIKVRIVQNTPYTDDVKGYARQWNFALRKEINSLINQAKKIIARRARRHGIRMKS